MPVTVPLKSHETGRVMFNAHIKGTKDTHPSIVKRRQVEFALAEGRQDFTGADLSGADLSGLNLETCIFDRANLNNARFMAAKLNSARFSGARLLKADLSHVDASHADFSDAFLHDATFEKAKLSFSNFLDAMAVGTSFDEADMQTALCGALNGTCASFRKTILRHVIFIGADLLQADFTDAQLHGVNFNRANLRQVNLTPWKLVARAMRSDGHEYMAFVTPEHGVYLRAGCRTWATRGLADGYGDAEIPATRKALDHTELFTDPSVRSEAIDIINFIEGRLSCIAGN